MRTKGVDVYLFVEVFCWVIWGLQLCKVERVGSMYSMRRIQ